MYNLRSSNGEVRLKFDPVVGKELFLKLKGSFDNKNGKKIYRFEEDNCFSFQGFKIFIWPTDYIEIP